MTTKPKDGGAAFPGHGAMYGRWLLAFETARDYLPMNERDILYHQRLRGIADGWAQAVEFVAMLAARVEEGETE
jgi:hypothetical protein